MNYPSEIGYIGSSKYRQNVMEYLTTVEAKTPTDIAKHTGIRTNHISKTLKELSNKGVIKCLNDEARKGRLYAITDKGVKVLEEMR